MKILHGHMCLSTHVVVRGGQVCYVSMGNLVSMLVDKYLHMWWCKCLCVDVYMCMNMIVS